MWAFIRWDDAVKAKKLQAAGVDRWMRGLESASDHAPTWITLK